MSRAPSFLSGAECKPLLGSIAAVSGFGFHVAVGSVAIVRNERSHGYWRLDPRSESWSMNWCISATRLRDRWSARQYFQVCLL